MCIPFNLTFTIYCRNCRLHTATSTSLLWLRSTLDAGVSLVQTLHPPVDLDTAPFCVHLIHNMTGVGFRLQFENQIYLVCRIQGNYNQEWKNTTYRQCPLIHLLTLYVLLMLVFLTNNIISHSFMASGKYSKFNLCFLWVKHQGVSKSFFL